MSDDLDRCDWPVGDCKCSTLFAALIEKLQAENARLREALQFYADPLEKRRWKCVGGHDRCSSAYPSKDCPYCESIAVPDFYEELDFGEAARAALAAKMKRDDRSWA